MEAVILDTPGACVRAVVGLLNADGGRLLAVALEEREPKKLCAELCQAIQPDCSPFVACAITELGGGRVVAITVRPGRRKPYFIAGEEPADSAWRWAEGMPEPSLMEPETLRALIRESDGPVYDRQRSLRQGLTHEGLRQAFLRYGLPLGRPQRITLGLVDRDGLYTNLAWMTSDQRAYRAELLWVEGSEPTGLVRKRKTVRACFTELPRRVGVEMRRMLRKRARGVPAGGPDCSERWMEAALCQLFQLMDFDGDGTLRFCLYDDRLEASAYGGPPKSADRAGLRLGEPTCRNKNLLRVLERLLFGLREGSYAPPPDLTRIQYDGSRFRMTLYRDKGMEEEEEENATADAPAADSPAARALALMQGKPYTSKDEVAFALKLTMRQACLLLNRMERDGLVRGLIPNSLYCLDADVYCPPPLRRVHIPARADPAAEKARSAEGER